MSDQTTVARTMPGKRYRCESCGSEFLVTRPGNLPQCCGVAVQPKAAAKPPAPRR